MRSSPGRIRRILSALCGRGEDRKPQRESAYYSAVGTAFQGFHRKNGAAVENVIGAGGVIESPEISDF